MSWQDEIVKLWPETATKPQPDAGFFKDRERALEVILQILAGTAQLVSSGSRPADFVLSTRKSFVKGDKSWGPPETLTAEQASQLLERVGIALLTAADVAAVDAKRKLHKCSCGHSARAHWDAEKWQQLSTSHKRIHGVEYGPFITMCSGFERTGIFSASCHCRLSEDEVNALFEG